LGEFVTEATMSQRLQASAMPSSDAVIKVKALAKTYKNGTQAVKGVSFEVQRGEIFGILGPNGAGKSTTIGMLGTLVKPTGGDAWVDGFDVRKSEREIRRRIGFAMQEAGVDQLATGREFLILQARLYGIDRATAAKRAKQLLTLFELDGAGDKRIGGYSGGMKRRIDLAAALIHLPKIIFLDEPTEGLDPRSRQKLWATLKRLNKKLGATILLSTHYMEEADKLCDRLAIIDQGLIVVQDTPKRLKASVGGQSLILEYSPQGGAAPLARAEGVLKADAKIRRLVVSRNEVHAYVDDAAQHAPALLRALESAQAGPMSLRIQQPTLDDVYLKYTGRRLENNKEASE
jgi:ABC-2 type transport system ATP-binding protein